MNAHSKAAESVTEDGEIITTTSNALAMQDNKSLAVSLARAEIDMQVTTAHAFPRSVDRAVKNIMSLATLDEQTAEECVYALPRGGKPIKGPSVRLAEIIQSQWGNCRTGARVVHVDRIERYVEAEGVFHDLETNSATTARVRRRISDSKGKLYNEDMIVVTGNAACSIAKRNAILGGVPKAAWRKAYDAVEQVISGDIKTLTERRDRAMKAFAAFGVTPDRVFLALGIGGMDDITLEHMTTLTGMHAALKSGEATVEEMFRREQPAGGTPKDLNGKLDALAATPGATQAQNDATSATSGGEATAEPARSTETSPAADQASTQSPAPNQQTASDQAAAGNISADTPTTGSDPAAATVQWPADKVPANAAEYVEYATAWIAQIGVGQFTADGARTRWKGELKLRNSCGVDEETRDPIKSALDAACTAKKAA